MLRVIIAGVTFAPPLASCCSSGPPECLIMLQKKARGPPPAPSPEEKFTATRREARATCAHCTRNSRRCHRPGRDPMGAQAILLPNGIMGTRDDRPSPSLIDKLGRGPTGLRPFLFGERSVESALPHMVVHRIRPYRIWYLRVSFGGGRGESKTPLWPPL